jgi:hypothetical protein
LIPTEAYRPLVPLEFTKAPEDMLESRYVKRPPSHTIQADTDFLREAAVLETLRTHPRPNVRERRGRSRVS